MYGGFKDYHMYELEKEKEKRLSKFLSGLLRHFPHEYNLNIDSNGWADREKVEEICGDKYGWFVPEHIETVVNNDSKGRYELKGNKLRALSGHSIDVNVGAEISDTPTYLYHGTAPQNLDSILKEGIKPMDRQLVHLSIDKETALNVGKRHTKEGEPVVLRVDTECVENCGLEIHNPQEELFTVKKVNPNCLTVVNE